MWLQERKQVFRQWVESRWPSSSQLDLLTWKPALRINPFTEDFIWQNGKLYKQVKNDFLQHQPVLQQPACPVVLVPGWWITWCSNSTQPGNYSYEIH